MGSSQFELYISVPFSGRKRPPRYAGFALHQAGKEICKFDDVISLGELTKKFSQHFKGMGSDQNVQTLCYMIALSRILRQLTKGEHGKRQKLSLSVFLMISSKTLEAAVNEDQFKPIYQTHQLLRGPAHHLQCAVADHVSVKIVPKKRTSEDQLSILHAINEAAENKKHRNEQKRPLKKSRNKRKIQPYDAYEEDNIGRQNLRYG